MNRSTAINIIKILKKYDFYGILTINSNNIFCPITKQSLIKKCKIPMFRIPEYKKVYSTECDIKCFEDLIIKTYETKCEIYFLKVGGFKFVINIDKKYIKIYLFCYDLFSEFFEHNIIKNYIKMDNNRPVDLYTFLEYYKNKLFYDYSDILQIFNFNNLNNNGEDILFFKLLPNTYLYNLVKINMIKNV